MSSANESTPAGDAHHNLRERLETAVGAAKEVGVPFEAAERVLYWWKHLGVRSAISFFFIVLLPVLNAECRQKAAEHVVTAFAEYHDIDLEVGDWSGSFFGWGATAKDVAIKVRGPFAKPELFTAEHVRIQLSAWRWLRWNAARLPWNWRLSDVVKDVEVERPQIYAERTLSGQWNFDELFESDASQPAAESSSSAVSIPVPHLELKNLRLQWVEQMPSQSGGGLVGASTATIYLEDVYARFDNVNVERDGRILPVTFVIDGRAADGKFSLRGRAEPLPDNRRVLAAIYLENIGAAAFGRLVIRSALVPTSGTMTGRIELDVKGSTLGCRTNVTLQNVHYGLNPTAPLQIAGREQVERELAAMQLNRGVFTTCNDDTSRPGFRFVQTFQTALTQEALADASPTVRRVAAVDYRSVTNQVVDSAVAAAGDALARKAGEMVGKAFGVPPANNSANAFAPAPPPAKNDQAASAVSRGLKSMGSGIKKLFGGGDKKKKKKQ